MRVGKEGLKDGVPGRVFLFSAQLHCFVLGFSAVFLIPVSGIAGYKEKLKIQGV